jgi:glycosyltransferase involved in cell wall biosynthesis
MKISIAMAAYNGAQYLQNQLDSILCQSHLPDELVVCDDCSTDGTCDVLEAFRQRAPFTVHIHRNGRNLGYVRNFEQAISLCTGDIILLSDQDDVWHSDRIQRSLAVFQENPECGYVFSDAGLIDHEDRPLEGTLWQRVAFTPNRQRAFEDHDQQPSDIFQKNCVTGATLAIRAKCRGLIFPFPQLDGIIHDAWISMTLSLLGFYGVAIKEPFIFYRIHPKQQMGVKVEKKRNIYRRLERRLVGKRLDIARTAFSLTTIKTHLDKLRNLSAHDRFERNLGRLHRHLDFRLNVMAMPSNIKRLVPISKHYLRGGYTLEEWPRFSALKDLIY